MDKELQKAVNATAHVLSQRQYAIFRQGLAEVVKQQRLAGVPKAEILAYLNQAAVDGQLVRAEAIDG